MTKCEINPGCVEKFNFLKEAIDGRGIRKECIEKFGDISKGDALLQQSIINMEKRFDKIEDLITNLPEKLDKKFATKDELRVVKEKADRNTKIFGTVGIIILGGLITAILKLIII